MRREMGLGEQKFSEANAPGDTFPGEDDEGELNFNLLPPEFEREMEQKSEALDREAMPPTEEEEKWRREFDLLEELVEGTGKETPVAGFLEGLEIPPAASIQSDAEAERFLKPLLARLARYGTALDTCKHCTPRNAYRLLIDKILPDLGVYEPLVGSDYVHHVCAYDVCEECLADDSLFADDDEKKDDSEPPF
jgi:hypothetical protein